MGPIETYCVIIVLEYDDNCWHNEWLYVVRTLHLVHVSIDVAVIAVVHMIARAEVERKVRKCLKVADLLTHII